MSHSIQFEKSPIPFLKGGLIEIGTNGIKITHALQQGEIVPRITYHYGLGAECVQDTKIQMFLYQNIYSNNMRLT